MVEYLSFSLEAREHLLKDEPGRPDGACKAAPGRWQFEFGPGDRSRMVTSHVSFAME